MNISEKIKRTHIHRNAINARLLSLTCRRRHHPGDVLFVDDPLNALFKKNKTRARRHAQTCTRAEMSCLSAAGIT